MAFKRILAAVRATQGQSQVFEQALEVAGKEEGAVLMLYHCLQTKTLAEYEDRIVTTAEMDMSRVEQTFRDRVQSEIEHRRAWLGQLCLQAKEKGVTARCVVEEGKPGPRIIEFAEHWKADLIVLGRTHRSSLVDCLFGTVSDHVIHSAKCSLLLVQ
jgi:nucleotide-binding universal stress UspA family protein